MPVAIVATTLGWGRKISMRMEWEHECLCIRGSISKQSEWLAIESEIKKHPEMVRMCISNSLIQREKLDALFLQLGSDVRLSGLSMRECSLGVSEIGALSSFISTCATLRALDLGGNNMGDRGIIALAFAFTSNRQLKTIAIDGNAMTDVGAYAMIEYINRDESLRSLDISSNLLSVEGCDNMTIAVRQHHSANIAGTSSQLITPKSNSFVERLKRENIHLDFAPRI